MQNSNDRKQMIQQGFDTVAAGYDHPSLSFFPETAKRLVEHLQLNSTDHLLDVCTGTGCVALTAAEKLSQGKVTGIDLSSGMLQQARNKAKNMTARDGEMLAMQEQLAVKTVTISSLNRWISNTWSLRTEHSMQQPAALACSF